MLDISQILPVFFAAMQDGYANDGNARKSTIVKFHGLTMVLFNSGDFQVQDSRLVVPNSSRSSGHTLILYKGEPVWEMSYQGWYDKTAIPFLKRALRETYDHCDFIGGRGPYLLLDASGKTYTNDVELHDWRHFRGKESIDLYGQNLGWHDYQGLLLVE
jgi:hypothetical protein